MRARLERAAELIGVARQCVREAKWAALVFRFLTEGLSDKETVELDELAAELGRDGSEQLRLRQPHSGQELLDNLDRLTGGRLSQLLGES